MGNPLGQLPIATVNPADTPNRHSRVSGNPERYCQRPAYYPSGIGIPAYAGMTVGAAGTPYPLILNLLKDDPPPFRPIRPSPPPLPILQQVQDERIGLLVQDEWRVRLQVQDGRIGRLL